MNENGSRAFSVVANHSCDDGFALVGNSNRTCTGDGSSTIGAFNGVAPTCERESVNSCIPLSNMPNVQVHN